MKKIFVGIFLGFVLAAVGLIANHAQAGGKPVAPPAFSITMNSALIYQSNPGDPYSVYLNLDSNWKGVAMNMPQYAGESWATLYLPSGNVFLTGYGEQLFVSVPVSQMPAAGTPIKADITSFWGGKTATLTYTITNWPN